MHNHGNFIVSLGAMCAWLAPQAEALGVEIYPGFAAAETLHDDDGRVTGVRIGDMGVAQGRFAQARLHPGHRHPRQGHRARRRRARPPDQAAGQAVRARRRQRSAGLLDRHQGAVAGAGRPRRSPARSCTRCGWPADTQHLRRQLPVPPRQATASRWATSAASTTRDPNYQPYEAFQQWKNHPMIKPLLEGGSILSAGARAIVTGGWQSLPKVEMPGALLIGDTAGLLNVPKIKGTHQAIRSRHARRRAPCAVALAPRRLRREAARLRRDGRAEEGPQHQARLQARPVVRHVERGVGNRRPAACRRGR